MKRKPLHIVKPGSSEWPNYAYGFAAAPDYARDVPAAVIICHDTDDVRAALLYVTQSNLPFRIRGGRHNYEGHSSRVKDGVIIDIRCLNAIQRLSENLFQAGSGVNMFELTEFLNVHGQAMPYATGGTVGLAGFLMGGGVSVNSRLWGLGSMHVESFLIVLADGTCHSVSPESDPDLFWATLGGGDGNYGIVISFTLRTHTLTTVAAMSITWDWDQFERVMDTWQHELLQQPRELTTFLTLRANRTIELSGQWTADMASEETVLQALDPLLKVESPLQTTIQCIPHALATRMFLRVSEAMPLGWHAAIKQQLFKSTSSFAYLPFPPKAIAKLKQHLERHPQLQTVPDEQSMIRLLGGGGASQDEGLYQIATPHQQSLFILQYDGYWSDPIDAQAVQEWTNNAKILLSPYTTGAYSNYVDDEIPISERNVEYYGNLASRLREVKHRVDPTNLFSFPHSLTP